MSSSKILEIILTLFHHSIWLPLICILIPSTHLCAVANYNLLILQWIHILCSRCSPVDVVWADIRLAPVFGEVRYLPSCGTQRTHQWCFLPQQSQEAGHTVSSTHAYITSPSAVPSLPLLMVIIYQFQWKLNYILWIIITLSNLPLVLFGAHSHKVMGELPYTHRGMSPWNVLLK